MSKLYATILSMLFCTTHILGMINSVIGPVPENFSDDLTEQILYWAVERSIDVNHNNLKDNIQLIRNIGLLNKKYNTYVNHPITTLNSINYIAEKLCAMNSMIAIEFLTSGSKNYITCSKKLFTETITAQEIKDLVANGADLNYIKIQHDPFILLPMFPIYLIHHNRPQDILKTALDLGADINQKCRLLNDYPLEYAIENNLTDIVELLLQYAPQQKHFPNAISKGNIDIIDLLVQAGESPDTGLSSSIFFKYNSYSQSEHEQKMKLLTYFLDKKADPTPCILTLYKNTFETIKIQHELEYDALDDLELLCNHGGYNEKALSQAYIAQEKIDRIVNMLEKNKPRK